MIRATEDCQNLEKIMGIDNRPYLLGFDPNLQLICIKGPLRLTRNFRHIPSVQYYGDLNKDGFLSVPASRINFLICEAIGVPEETSQSYIDARQSYVSPPIEHLEIIKNYFEQANIFKRPLLLHQLDFCAFSYNNNCAWNASEQGTGKTAAVLALLHLWRLNRVLVICPSSLANEWRNEINELFNPEYAPTLYDITSGSKRERAEFIKEYNRAINSIDNTNTKQSILIVNYEVVNDLKPTLKQFRPQALVCDESWRIKSNTAAVTKASTDIRIATTHGIILGGTPISNSIGDLWSQLKVVSNDPNMESYWEFLGRYAIMKTIYLGQRQVQKPIGVSNLPGLLSRLEPYWFRVTKSCCSDLPPKRYETVYINMSPEQTEFYERLRTRGEAALGDPLALTNAAVLTLRLQQVAGGFRPPSNALDIAALENLNLITFNPDEWLQQFLDYDDSVSVNAQPLINLNNNENYNGSDNLYLNINANPNAPRSEPTPLPCPKVDWVLDFARDRLLGDPTIRVIIWCRFNAEVRRLYNQLADVLSPEKVAEVTGNTNNILLDTIKSSFNSRDPNGVQVIIAQVKKLAYGHNLQSGDHNIYYSNSWSYIERAQSEDRTHRIGRNGTVTYWDLVSPNTVDVDVIEALRRKEDLAIVTSPFTGRNYNNV